MLKAIVTVLGPPSKEDLADMGEERDIKIVS